MSSTLAWDIIARDRASRVFEHVGHAVEGTTHKVEHSSKSLRGLKTAAKVGLVGLGALTVGAGLVAEKMIDVVKAAADDQHAQKILAATAKNAAGATRGQIATMEEWIAKQGKAKGVMLNDLRPAMGKLLTVTHSVTKAQHLASLAMDVSAGSGKSLDSITLALVKAQNGSLGGLSRLGVATKDAHGKTLSLQQVTKELAKTYRGDAATSAKTATGQMNRLKVAFEEGKVALGNKLLPVLGRFSAWLLDKAVPAAQKFASQLSKQLGPAVRSISKWFQGSFLPAVRNVVRFWVTQFAPVMMKFYRSILPSLKSAFDNVKKGIHNAQPTIKLLLPIFKALWSFIKGFLLPLMAYLANHQLRALGVAFKVVGAIIGTWGKIITGLWNNIMVPFFKFIYNAAAKVMRTWADMLRVIAHAPGFGWAKDLANTLDHAAAAASHTASNINKIPTYHKVTIDYHVVRTGDTTHSSGGGHTAPTSAAGGWAPARVPRLIGEHGPEMFVPEQSGQIIPHSRTAAAMMGGGGEDVHVHLHLDGKEIHTALLKRKRINGGKLGLA